MLDANTKLTILYDDNSVFTDFSQDMNDFTRDTNSINLETGNDRLLIGFYKPIDKVYIDFNAVNSQASILTIQYYNGTTFVDVDGQIDETKGFTRSGFLQWTREQDDQVSNVVNGIDLYWYSVSTDTTHVDTIFNAIGIILSDDTELKIKVPTILDAASLTGKPSHILAHVSARNWIIQDLRNHNYGKWDQEETQFSDIIAWDLLQHRQFQEAATFYALHQIYFNFSDEPGDKHEIKAKSYFKKYEDQMELAAINLDLDDDGEEDPSEKGQTYNSRIVTR